MTKKEIMTKAWKIYRKNNGEVGFAESLRRAWLCSKAGPVNEAIIAAAKAEAGVTEETDTWAGWKERGFEVIHGSKALFGCELIWGSRGEGAWYKARFFGASQVQEVA